MNDVSDSARRRAGIVAALEEKGLKSDLVDEFEYRDRYRVFRRNHSAIVDVFFDGKERITGIESGSADGKSSLVFEAIEAVECLPSELLRPRFSERHTSPAALVERHKQKLADAGLEVYGVRLAQYQIRYDIEDPSLGARGGSTQLSIRYNKRGVVTWAEGDSGSVANRAIEALGLKQLAHGRAGGEANQDSGD